MFKGLRSLAVFLVALGALSAAAVQSTRKEGPVSEGLLPVLRSDAPRFWKGNLHTHSFWSDGDDFPEMIADWYRRHGYHFLGLSDHNILSDGDKWIDITPKNPRELALKKYLARFGPSWVERRTKGETPQVRLKPLREFRSVLEEPGRFLLIPAEEITHRFAKLPVHMNAVNLRDVILPLDGGNVAETITVNHRLVMEQRQKTGWPMLAFLNHPNFGWGIRAEDLVAAEELRFFEVFNGHPGVRNYGDNIHPGSERLWDIALALRLRNRLPILRGLATDDAHRYHVYGVGQVNPGRGWIMVRAPHLSAEALIRGMEAGDFYASSGVVLKDVRCTAKELALAIEPEKGVTYKTQFIATRKDADLSSEPQTDAAGKPLEFVTRKYSPAVGVVVAETDSLEPVYRLTGQEWYVRARVISSKPHPNPYQKDDVEMAWTQPAVPE